MCPGFVQTVFTEPCNLLTPNVKWWVHHYALDCHAKRVVWYLQGQGYNEESYNQNMTVFTIFSELPILFQVDFVWQNIVLSRFHKQSTVLWKHWIAVIKVKATAKVRHFKERPPGLCLLKLWICCKQIDMVTHHCKPGCYAKDWVAIFKFSVKVTISTELLILLQPNFVWW